MSRSPELAELNAWLDGELELARVLDVEARAAQDATVQAQLDRLRQVRASVREHADAWRAPEALQARVQASLDAALASPSEGAPEVPTPRESDAPRGARSDRPVAMTTRPASANATRAQDARGWRRWFVWESYVGALASVAMVALVAHQALLPAQDDARIQDEVLASHARAVVAQRLVDVASSDHHTVKPWLSARLDFSPPVDAPEGTRLVGARIDYVDDRPVAALVFQHAGHTVDAFAWPARERDSAPVFTSERGFRIARWTQGGMRHWAVSDLNAKEFDALVQALARAG